MLSSLSGHFDRELATPLLSCNFYAAAEGQDYQVTRQDLSHYLSGPKVLISTSEGRLRSIPMQIMGLLDEREKQLLFLIFKGISWPITGLQNARLH
jgi:hypothetical protein